MCGDSILVTLLKMKPHYNQSSCENAIPSPLAFYKELPPGYGYQCEILTVNRACLAFDMWPKQCITSFSSALLRCRSRDLWMVSGRKNGDRKERTTNSFFYILPSTLKLISVEGFLDLHLLTPLHKTKISSLYFSICFPFILEK